MTHQRRDGHWNFLNFDLGVREEQREHGLALDLLEIYTKALSQALDQGDQAKVHAVEKKVGEAKEEVARLKNKVGLRKTSDLESR